MARGIQPRCRAGGRAILFTRIPRTTRALMSRTIRRAATGNRKIDSDA